MDVIPLITIIRPGHAPQQYNLSSFNKPVLYIGRGQYHGSPGACNDIVIPEDVKYVSRAQCTLTFYENRWYINDDGSTNGIWYHGSRISSLAVNDGDKVYIGDPARDFLVLLFSFRHEEARSSIESYSLSGKNRFTLGRDSRCDIVIRSSVVSRVHAIITLERGVYYISDNNSTNGLMVNDRRLERKTPLRQMDKITVADTTMFFSDGALYLNRPVGGVGVVAQHLGRVVGKGKKKKRIMNDVSLTIQPNEFVAIIGGSGAGKTTLLNCLSGMTGFTDGDIFINGESIRSAGNAMRSIIGYVPQQDIVYDTLSLERMLYYSARLRMPLDTSPAEIRAKIDETLDIVELSEHRKTMISRLSGGQRKRASIAVELLASPKLFFLDEPSSGLDPGTEKHLMKMLRKLSETGKTVIMVTHTIENLDLCDRVVCMGKGGVVCYSGSPEQAAQYFGKERKTDIFDVLNENSVAAAQYYKQNYMRQESMPAQSQNGPEKSNKHKKKLSVLFNQFFVMSQRYLEIMRNSLPRMLLLLLMPVILAFLVCMAYQADGGLIDALGLSSIHRNNFAFLVARDTMSLISGFSCAAFWVGIFNSVQEISKEQNIYQRERFTGVAVMPYIMSKFSILTVLCAAQAAIMTLILKLMSTTVATEAPGTNALSNIKIEMVPDGLYFDDGAFIIELFLTTFLCVLSAMCLGLLISSMVSNDMALVICPICLLPQLLFSGVATELTGITEKFANIVSCRWSCVGLLTSVNVNDMYVSCKWDTTRYDLVESEIGVVSQWYVRDKKYLFGLDPVASSWIALGLICLACLLIAYIVLRRRGAKKA